MGDKKTSGIFITEEELDKRVKRSAYNLIFSLVTLTASVALNIYLFINCYL